MVYENTENNEYYCNPIMFNFVFGFLIYSWICVPFFLFCQIFIYSSALYARELHENLELQKADVCQRLNQFDAQMLESREEITELKKSILKLWSRHLSTNFATEKSGETTN